MHELNIKDVFRSERLRQMGTSANESATVSRTRVSGEKTSLKAGMEALMQELLGHTNIQSSEDDLDSEHDSDLTLH